MKFHHKLSIHIAVLFSALGAQAMAGPGIQVAICHLPDGNPANAQEIMVDEADVPDHLAHGDLLGECPPTAAELDPPEVVVDSNVQPSATEISGVDGGPPRPLARMYSDIGPGYSFDFVLGEVCLITQDPADLVEFQDRWPSTVLFEVTVPGANPADPATMLYLLGVDPSSVNPRSLNRHLAKIDPNLHGQHMVSSEAALTLLALVAKENRVHGLSVGINALTVPAQFSRRDTEEAVFGDDIGDATIGFMYDRNGFEWPYMKREGNFPSSYAFGSDTGVAEAFRVVEAEGRLGNRVRAMVTDGGFFPNDDFPPFLNFGDPVRTPNAYECSGGTPPTFGSACEAHGTHVALTGFGLPDNEFGTFGPGGPVTDLILLQSPSPDLSSIIRHIQDTIPAAIAERPRIINGSFSFTVPGGWCFAVCEPLDLLSRFLRDQGVLFVASAGNDGIDVDATDEICVFGCFRFEEAAILPCETDHVVCVGANTSFQQVPASYSNFGTSGDDGNSVDIYAPGTIYSVDARDADESNEMPIDDLQLVRGTSFSAPFASGVFALAMAANPALSNSEVTECIYDTSFIAFPSTGWRSINALGAVACAMGGSAPFVEITSPYDGQRFVRGIGSVVFRALADDYEDGTSLDIFWSSSRNGSLGSTAPGGMLTYGSLELAQGDHEICAATTDSSVRVDVQCIEIWIDGAPPIVEILQPDPMVLSTFSQASVIALNGIATDPDGPPPTEFYWDLRPSGGVVEIPVATGANTSLALATFDPGDYVLILRVVDSDGLQNRDFAEILITEATTDGLPTVTIDQPVSGSSFFSPDGGPVEIPLVATAQDPEDGDIPFEDIEWTVSTDGGEFLPLPVITTIICIRFEFGVCVETATQYDIELAPQASQTSTRYDIKGTVQDSDGNTNEAGNGKSTVFITQFI